MPTKKKNSQARNSKIQCSCVHENRWCFSFNEEIATDEVHQKFWQAVKKMDFNPGISEYEFKELIESYPYFIDAWAHLSMCYASQQQHFEARLVAEKAYELGRKAIPEEFKRGHNTLPSGFMSNRPFLRAVFQYALTLENAGRNEMVIDLCRELIQYDSDDRHGARYLLLEIAIREKNFEEAEALTNEYDDYSIEFMYTGLALQLVAGNANSDLIDLLYEKCLNINKHVSYFIIESRPKRPETMTKEGHDFLGLGIVVGSKEEAYSYFIRHKTILRNKKVRDWFKAKKMSK